MYSFYVHFRNKVVRNLSHHVVTMAVAICIVLVCRDAIMAVGTAD
jgi:hypothetical protein